MIGELSADNWQAGSLHTGITIRGGEKSIVENNVIDVGVAIAHPVNFQNFPTSSGAAKCFNNQNPAGKLFLGYEENLQQSLSELETAFDDVFLL